MRHGADEIASRLRPPVDHKRRHGAIFAVSMLRSAVEDVVAGDAEMRNAVRGYTVP